MGSTSMTLKEALDRIDDLETELSDTRMEMFNQYEVDAIVAAAVANAEERICRRCFGRFYTCNDEQYCSRDCREFRRQEPFETLWKQLHPNGSREPNRTFAAAL